MTTRIDKGTAKVLEGVAHNLFTDTREIIVTANGVMDSIYRAVKRVVAGREMAHVKYLLACYKECVKNDPSIDAAKGTVEQVTAAVNKLLKEGMELPENYTQARRLAYPPKTRAPRMPGETAEPSEGTTDAGEGTPATETQRPGRTLSPRMTQLVGFLLEMEADQGEAFAYAEQAIRNAYAEWTIERSLAADAADSLDMAEEA